ncbi:Hexokinase [Neonectria ditissima]|uniref:Phosphotransferase n=1 Tax=Neonectria ditissima TaxID=78410 RepID=A0A0N8H8Q1_9HYPO|nr:Hexokinase [Neonectria ditissima]
MPADHLECLLQELEELFTIDKSSLDKITDRFTSELAKGLSEAGGSIPMNTTWVTALPNGKETGTYLVLDLGGTNIRICKVALKGQHADHEVKQTNWRIPEELKTGDGDSLWEFVADCLDKTLKDLDFDFEDGKKIPLSFIFSYPMTQDSIKQGVLQRWTKGFSIKKVEGHDVAPMLTSALEKRDAPVVLHTLVNDTAATLIASAYVDSQTKIACVFGTGCNAAYVEECGSIPKLASKHLPKDRPMVVNCEWGAFDNENVVLPRTRYDVQIDEDSPRPGQQSFEKMIASLYQGEIFRLILTGVHSDKKMDHFQADHKENLEEPYSLDCSFLSAIEEDESEDLHDIHALFQEKFNISYSVPALKFIRRIAVLITTRAARLAACGIAAICKKKSFDTCHVGVEGSLVEHHPHFETRLRKALREMMDWPAKSPSNGQDPIELVPAQESSVGAAIITALTIAQN